MQEANGSPMPKGPRARVHPKNNQQQQQQIGTPQRSQRRGHPQQADTQHGSPSHPATDAHQTAVRNGRHSKNANNPNKGPNTGYTSLDGASSPKPTAPQTATPIKQTAYAGPTFHASPAPSSLPIPRFFSKSVPSAAAASGLQARLDASPSRGSTSPHPPAGIAMPIRREESPLDLLFNAHRAEQAKQNSSSPQVLLAKPRLTSNNSYQTGREGRDMFMLELDGAGSPAAPHTVTPFRERLDAARAIASPSHYSTQVTMDEQQRMEKSRALKEMLKVQSSQGPFSPSNDHGQGYSSASHFGQPPYGSPMHHGSHVPHVDTRQPEYRNEGYRGSPLPLSQAPARSEPDVKSMEADLRKLLKLGPST